MAVAVEQKVLQLEISVDDGLLVQVVDGADDLGAVELGSVLRELTLSLQVEVQLASVDILRHQAQPESNSSWHKILPLSHYYSVETHFTSIS